MEEQTSATHRSLPVKDSAWEHLFPVSAGSILRAPTGPVVDLTDTARTMFG